MVLARLTWSDVDALDRGVVVLIPIGSLEQHGPHLPLLTDTVLVTAVAEAAERRLTDLLLLTPTLWMGASSHHLEFPGTLDHPFDSLIGQVTGLIESLALHGFHRFYVLNGHGGNASPLDVALRTVKARRPNLSLGLAGYYQFCADKVAELLEGPHRTIRHACEAETSLMLHLKPEWVRFERAVDDGLAPDPPLRGGLFFFHEQTVHGVLGCATLATAEKGRAIFQAAVEGVVAELAAFSSGVALRG
ncbi:MAG: creatininase family protein [Fimbriimonadales bacterium]|nr:creatininase family protein [Fimbriimonadales bacterium]